MRSRIRFDASQKYGSGGLSQARRYMFSVTWNAPQAAFDSPEDFFEGKGMGAVYAHAQGPPVPGHAGPAHLPVRRRDEAAEHRGRCGALPGASGQGIRPVTQSVNRHARMSTRLKSLRKGYRENRASALAALGLLLFAISLLMYELLRDPPQYLEFHGFYEGLRAVTHGGRYGSHKEIYLKVQGLDRPIKAVDGWDRIKRMKLNRLVHFVVEPKSRWFFEPRVYYEAVAITANITVYDHRQ